MQAVPVGVDIAKNVFQIHYVDSDTGEIVNKPLKRAKSTLDAYVAHLGER